MKPLFHFTAILFVLFLASPAKAQQQITVELEEYSALHVSGRIDLELVPSDADEMQISYRMIDPDNISTEFKNGTLHIKIPTKIKNNEALDIVLPYQHINKIHAAAGAVINSARDLTADEVELSVASGGKIELSLQVREIHAKITQVSDIILYGSAEFQDVLVKTGGNYLAYDMECDTTNITVSGGGQGKISADKSLNATVKMKGFVGYRGNPPHKELNALLGGEIIKYSEDTDK